jgi:glycerol-3-phosphate dehydrogenase
LPIGKQANDGDSLVHGSVVLSKESIRHFVEEEMAVNIEDVLARRTRLLFLDAKQAVKQAPTAASAMAELLDKDDNWVKAQVEAFTQLAQQYTLK